MINQDYGTEVVFHYDNGQSDAFIIPLAPEEFKEQIQLLLERPWLTFHLFDQTVFVSMARVVKVEVKPSLTEIVGIGVFHNSQRVTAMSRGAAR